MPPNLFPTGSSHVPSASRGVLQKEPACAMPLASTCHAPWPCRALESFCITSLLPQTNAISRLIGAIVWLGKLAKDMTLLDGTPGGVRRSAVWRPSWGLSSNACRYKHQAHIKTVQVIELIFQTWSTFLGDIPTCGARLCKTSGGFSTSTHK